MKKFVALFFLFLFFFSCKDKKELIFLNKNAYEEPVWEDMLKLEKSKLSDVVEAFNAYKSEHFLDRETNKHFEKLVKRLKTNLDVDGYFTSDIYKYKKLLKFRNAIKSKERANTIQRVSTNTISKQIPNTTNFGNWKNLGPFGNPEVKWSATGNGAIDYIEMHPTNPAIMYACSRNGGLWKTVNYGKNWTPETDYFATNNTSCIEINEHNTSVFYLGAAEDGIIWYSSDAGNSWENRSTGLAGNIYEIKSDPTDASRVLAATTEGLYLSTNSGTSWTRKIAGSYTDIDVTDNWDLIVVAKDNQDIAPKLQFSTDKGDNFIEKDIITSPATVDKFYLAIHRTSAGVKKIFAYGIKDSNTPTRFIGLWKSDFTPNPSDGSSYFSFTEVKHSTYSYPNGAVPLTYENNANGYKAETSDYYGSVNPYSHATWISDFYVSPNDPDKMLTLREKFWGSEDGGIIWSYKPSYGSSNWADNRFITTNRAKDSIFWCNDGGMWAIKETDLFPTEAQVTASGLSKYNFMASKVVPKNGDICVSEGSQMDVSLSNKGVFITGGQDIGQIFTRNGRDTHVASADVYRGRIKPTEDSKFITGNLNVNLDGGTDLFSVYNNINPDYFNTNRLYGFTSKNKTTDTEDVRLVRSAEGVDAWLLNNYKGENLANAGGHNWEPVHKNWQTISFASVGVTQIRPGTFEQSRANKDLAFFGDANGGKLFFTENLSNNTPNWLQLSNAPSAGHYRIATHQFNENLIVIATNFGVFISKDKGISWSRRGNIPTNNPLVVLVDRNTSEGIYVMAELTVYYIDETLDEWQEFNRGLPLQNLSDMRIAYFPDGDDRLYVSKYGRGVWASSLKSVLNKTSKKPIADFSIHGNSKSNINTGDEVQLLSQSLNATNLQWKIENGSNIINIADKEAPKVTLNTAGFYKVSLTATNTNGSNTRIKEHYIEVIPNAITANCTPNSDGNLPWYKGFNNIKFNTENYDVSSSNSYIQSNKTFYHKVGETVTFFTDDNYTPGYNFYSKAWIDYNNDGDFDDANEEIISTNGSVETFTGNFTIPNSVVLNTPLLVRVTGIESSSAPTSCQNTSIRQTIDFKIIVKPSVTFTSSDTILSENSVVLHGSYNGAYNVINAGFVYSSLDGELTLENSEVVKISSLVNNNHNYQQTINNLDYNTKFYYRPYVQNQYGTYYGEKKSFELSTYKLPMLSAVFVNNLGSNNWILKGKVYPENTLFDELYFEYGEGNFDNKVAVDPRSYPTDKSFDISKNINLTSTNVNQFRVRAVKAGKTIISNYIDFNKPQQTYCTPTLTENLWFRRISNVTFNGISNNSSDSGAYLDNTSVVFSVNANQTYPISVTDSYTPGFNLNYIIFIDYNNDGDFDDFNEIAAQGTPNSDTFTANINISDKNVKYNTNLRMRVVAYSNQFYNCNLSAGQVEDYSIKIVKNYWTGTTNTDWDAASNWSLNSVPTSTTDAEIPAGLTNYPIASGNVNVKNLVLIENSKLTVNGNLTNTGVIKINSGASLIAKQNVTGKVSYSRMLGAKNKWYLVSPPVKDVSISSLINSHYFAKGTNSNIGIATYKNDGTAWNYLKENAIGNLISGKGYSMRLLGPGKVTFVGNMVTENVAIPITKNTNGYNLVGNPYPSYLPINQSAQNLHNILKINGTDNSFLEEQTLWVWDQSLNLGQGDYIAINQASEKQYIAPGQAFFVKSNGNHQFLFTEDMQSHQSNDVFYKSINNRFKIKVTVNDAVNKVATEIYYIDNTTVNWDNGYDSSLFESNSNTLELYTKLVNNNEDKKLKIQSLPKSNYQSMIIPVVVKKGANENVTFTIEAQNIPNKLNVVLEDRKNNIFTKLEQIQDVYNTQLTENNDDRFYIHVNSLETLKTDNFIEKNISVFVKKQELKILGLYSKKSSVKLFNTLGKVVYQKNFFGNGNNTFRLSNLSKGVYIVMLSSTKNKRISKKIIID